MSGFVFISHSHQDRDYVERLAGFLRGENIEVWYDAQLVVGRRFDHALEDKIKQSKAFIVVMTPHSQQSEWVQRELKVADSSETEIMPILLEGDVFQDYQWIHAARTNRENLPGQDFVQTLRTHLSEGEWKWEQKAHKGQVRSVAYPAKNPELVASGGTDMYVHVWNSWTGEKFRSIPGATWPVAFNGDGSILATGDLSYVVDLWDMETGKLIKQVGRHKKALTSIAISPDGNLLVTGSADTSEHIWDLRTGELIRTLAGRVRSASPLVIEPGGEWLVAPTEAGSGGLVGAGMWDLQTGRPVGTLKGGHRGSAHDVTVSWDGSLIATGGPDARARVWDAKTQRERFTVGNHTKAVRAVAFSPSGYRLATGSVDQSIRLWDATNGAPIKCITKRAGGIYDLAYAPDGRTLASGHGDGGIRVWTA